MIATYVGEDGISYHVPCTMDSEGTARFLHSGAELPANARILSPKELRRYLQPRPAAGRRIPRH